MKKLMTAVIALHFAYSYAQITLTKDLNFASNGEYTYPDSGSYTKHKFLGDKILMSYTYLNTYGPYTKYAQFIRLNSDGSYDSSFGNNGKIIDVGNTGMADIIMDATPDFLITYVGYKYNTNGQIDSDFYTNSSNNGLYQRKYSKLFSDGKMLIRKDDQLTKFLTTGNLDTTYGNSGNLNTVSYNDEFQQGFIDEIAAYEFGSGTGTINTTGVRKINTTNGLLDTNYGINGLGVTSLSDTSVRNCIYHSSDGSTINMLQGGSSTGYQNSVSKTNSNGFLETSFGTGGVFPLAINLNATNYIYYNQFYTNNSNKLFFLLKSESGDIDVASYSFSGALININNLEVLKTGYNVYDGYSQDEFFDFAVYNNYLYLFTPKKTIRYIISESSLHVDENKDKSQELVFNNPFKDELNIKTNEKIKSVNIYDESGRFVIESKEAKNIDTSFLTKGVYIIKIITESNKVISKKGIKN